ncbi:MAG: rhomboid family intramembrane serine protease [Mycobacteriaceae bacterium]
MGAPGGVPQQPALPGCVRHANRPTGLSCVRCMRPACPDCLRPASVGFHCVECIKQAQSQVRPVRNTFGTPMTQAQSRPYVTYSLMTVNITIFVLALFLGMNTSSGVADKLTKTMWLWMPAVADGEFWRIATSGFIHLGIIHIVLNMYSLYVLGGDVERALGRTRYIAVYMISLLGGSALVMWLAPLDATAGASGAIFGLMGAELFLLLKLKISPQTLLTLIAINIFISVTVPNISLWGHLGGLAAGAVATGALLYLPDLVLKTGRSLTQQQALRVGWQGMSAVAAVICVVIVVRIFSY